MKNGNNAENIKKEIGRVKAKRIQLTLNQPIVKTYTKLMQKISKWAYHDALVVEKRDYIYECRIGVGSRFQKEKAYKEKRQMK